MNRVVALISGGVVFNCIIADPQWANNNLANLNSEAAVDITGTSVCIGWTWDGVNFYPPVEND